MKLLAFRLEVGRNAFHTECPAPFAFCHNGFSGDRAAQDSASVEAMACFTSLRQARHLLVNVEIFLYITMA
jgi:hypothetical protein